MNLRIHSECQINLSFIILFSGRIPTKTSDCNSVSNNNNNRSYYTSHSNNYITPLHTTNTTNTTILLDKAVTCDLKIKGFRANTEKGCYTAVIDTGANLPAINTTFAKK